MNILIQGNSINIPLKDESIQCVITSPPYYGLRDYGTAIWEGGDENCSHNPQQPDGGYARKNRTTPSGRGGMYKKICGKCGAIRIDNQLGVEESPDEYVKNLMLVFSEIKRVLKDKGTFWLNIGDTYTKGSKKIYKNLIGIPWKIAFALQEDGWYIRSDIIWQKTNPVPESVKDRPTKSYEHIFLISKQALYYYDYKSVLEDSLTNSDGCTTRNIRDVWTVSTKPNKEAHFAVFPEKLIEPCIKAGSKEKDMILDPFSGSGTVGIVAKRYNREFIGIDLNYKYIQMAKVKLSDVKK